MEEFEVKFLDIDVAAIEKKLKAIGAKNVAEFFYKRRVFDYSDMRLDKQASWLRLRTDGKETTLTYKRRLGTGAHDGSTNDEGMEEIEVSVGDFEAMGTMLVKLGFKEKFYQENKRIRWIKDDVEFDIDFWPRVKPYLEIEASNWEKIDKAIALLELNPADKKIFSANQVFRLSGFEPNDYQRMTFGEFIKRKILTS